MSAILGVTCTFVRGELPPRQTELDVWIRRGVDGYGAKFNGARGAAATLTAVMYEELEELATWRDAILALVGTSGTVVTDTATSTSNVLVLRVGPPIITPARLVAGEGSGEEWHRCELQVDVVTL